MYKSPVDGQKLVEVKQDDGSVKYRDRGTGQMFDQAYAEENFEKVRESGATSAKADKPAKKTRTRQPRANKENGTKTPPTPKVNGQSDEDDEEELES